MFSLINTQLLFFSLLISPRLSISVVECIFYFFFFIFYFLFFFFFQAEDGIRDKATWLEFRRVLFRSAISRKLLLCIRRLLLDNRPYAYESIGWKTQELEIKTGMWRHDISAQRLIRSEERRVGKECRSRWSQYH